MVINDCPNNEPPQKAIHFIRTKDESPDDSFQMLRDRIDMAIDKPR